MKRRPLTYDAHTSAPGFLSRGNFNNFNHNFLFILYIDFYPESGIIKIQNK